MTRGSFFRVLLSEQLLEARVPTCIFTLVLSLAYTVYISKQKPTEHVLWFSALKTLLNFNLNFRRDVTIQKNTFLKKSIIGHSKPAVTSVKQQCLETHGCGKQKRKCLEPGVWPSAREACIACQGAWAQLDTAAPHSRFPLAWALRRQGGWLKELGFCHRHRKSRMLQLQSWPLLTLFLSYIS